MKMPTQAQLNAGLRYGGSWIATGGAIVVTIGLIPPDTAHALVDAAQKVLGDLKQLVGDSYILAGLAFPVVMGLLAKFGYSSANPEKQKQAVVSDQPNTIVVQTNSPEAAKQAANAMAAIPEVQKVVTAQSVADATPSEKIVSK